MKRAVPVLILSVAGLVPVWRYEPSTGASTTTSTVAESPAPASSSSSPGTQTFTGTTVTTEKGDVQVRITYNGSEITAVQMLKQPNHPQTTAAVPKLIAETLKAQSADIDTVSGATLTSDGYKESLQAAIDAKGA
ncbi:FMN-binding protein [Streptomyces sp. ID05-04B]|uniref:FMN-binding protein n=1 Tax=unclassified Streptomyces TaxID=2593676 RepID=UPI000D1B6F58|nr:MULTISPECIES: FMN-binding protein [unclassified Streptomyces]AVV44940.1 FMN-binding domain-containing protein [Streptomyces sp. P3]MDX5564849.1 FMN-binding protein [Streptomyces sp. ID05-04B]